MSVTPFELTIGSERPVTIDWADWIADLPSGQALNSDAHAFDGGDCGLTISYDSIVGNKSIIWLNASAGTAGYCYLKVTATSTTAGPEPDYKEVRHVPIHVVAKRFVEDAD